MPVELTPSGFMSIGEQQQVEKALGVKGGLKPKKRGGGGHSGYKKIVVEKGGAIRIGKTHYHAGAIVPNTGGRTARQIQEEMFLYARSRGIKRRGTYTISIPDDYFSTLKPIEKKQLEPEKQEEQIQQVKTKTISSDRPSVVDVVYSTDKPMSYIKRSKWDALKLSGVAGLDYLSRFSSPTKPKGELKDITKPWDLTTDPKYTKTAYIEPIFGTSPSLDSKGFKEVTYLDIQRKKDIKKIPLIQKERKEAKERLKKGEEYELVNKEFQEKVLEIEKKHPDVPGLYERKSKINEYIKASADIFPLTASISLAVQSQNAPLKPINIEKPIPRYLSSKTTKGMYITSGFLTLGVGGELIKGAKAIHKADIESAFENIKSPTIVEETIEGNKIIQKWEQIGTTPVSQVDVYGTSEINLLKGEKIKPFVSATKVKTTTTHFDYFTGKKMQATTENLVSGWGVGIPQKGKAQPSFFMLKGEKNPKFYGAVTQKYNLKGGEVKYSVSGRISNIERKYYIGKGVFAKEPLKIEFMKETENIILPSKIKEKPSFTFEIKKSKKGRTPFSETFKEVELEYKPSKQNYPKNINVGKQKQVIKVEGEPPTTLTSEAMKLTQKQRGINLQSVIQRSGGRKIIPSILTNEKMRSKTQYQPVTFKTAVIQKQPQITVPKLISPTISKQTSDFKPYNPPVTFTPQPTFKPTTSMPPVIPPFFFKPKLDIGKAPTGKRKGGVSIFGKSTSYAGLKLGIKGKMKPTMGKYYTGFEIRPLSKRGEIIFEIGKKKVKKKVKKRKK